MPEIEVSETKKGKPRPGVFEKTDNEANVISGFEVEYKIEALTFESSFYIEVHAQRC